MTDINNIPENVREEIRKTFEESAMLADKKVPDVILHLLNQIGFEMYKSGWRDAHRAMNKALEMSEMMMK